MSKNRTRISLAQTATRLADQRALWEPLVSFDPAERYYVRLAATANFEAWLLTWLPGQGTDWHDHGGSAGAFLTLRGALTEQCALTRPGGAPTIVPHAVELVAGALRVFGAKHVHQVQNGGSEPAVSLHVYAPALRTMNTYRPEGQQLRLVAAELAGVAW